MVTQKQKKKKRETFQAIFFSVLIGIFLIGFVGFLIISNLRISQKRTELISQIEFLQKEIKILEGKNENLKAGILQTESDVYWEERVREQGFIKKGEKQVVVKKETEEEEVEKGKSLKDKILEWFGF